MKQPLTERASPLDAAADDEGYRCVGAGYYKTVTLAILQQGAETEDPTTHWRLLFSNESAKSAKSRKPWRQAPLYRLRNILQRRVCDTVKQVLQYIVIGRTLPILPHDMT